MSNFLRQLRVPPPHARKWKHHANRTTGTFSAARFANLPATKLRGAKIPPEKLPVGYSPGGDWPTGYANGGPGVQGDDGVIDPVSRTAAFVSTVRATAAGEAETATYRKPQPTECKAAL